MSDLWSREAPTERGWYWARVPNLPNSPVPVFIDREPHTETVMASGLVVLKSGQLTATPAELFKDLRGPLCRAAMCPVSDLEGRVEWYSERIETPARRTCPTT